jgi:hypothetical protein
MFKGKFKVNTTAGPCACGNMPAAFPDLDHVYVKYNAAIKLSGVGKFKVIDGATNKAVLTYNLEDGYAQDRSYVSLNPTQNDCPSCFANSTGKFVYIKLPKTLLKGRWMYTFSLSDGFAVNPSKPTDLVPGMRWTIYTPDVEAPIAKTSNPLIDQRGVPISSPDFSMTFSEDIVLDSSLKATLHTVEGIKVATMTSSVPYGVEPATFTTKRRTVKNTLVLKTASGLKLTPSTRYFIKIPAGMVKDTAGNAYLGRSQCSGCDWPFTTATSQAPTVAGAPGSLCNNTIDTGTIAVSPAVNAENVPTTTSAITFRFCGDVKPGPKGLVSVRTAGEDGVTVAGLDLSKPSKDVMTISQTQPGKNDTVTIDFTSNALHPLTTYTVSIQEGTFISKTGEKNAQFEWNFATDSQPPPLKLKSTWPINNNVYNHSKIKTISVMYNASVFIGKKGKITLYEDSGAGVDGYEKILSFDVGGEDSGFVTRYKTSTSRRSAHEAPFRRGIHNVAEQLKCTGSCVTTKGAEVHLQVPKDDIIISGKSYQGSIEKGAVTGSIGQHAPAVTKEDWNFITMSPQSTVAFNNPLAVEASNAASAPTSSGAASANAAFNLGAMVAAMGAMLLAILGAAGLFVYTRRKKDDEEDDEEAPGIVVDPANLEGEAESSDEESSGDSGEEDEALIGGPEQKTGDGPGTAAKAYAGKPPPVAATAVPDCLQVNALGAKVMKMKDAYAEVKSVPAPAEDGEQAAPPADLPGAMRHVLLEAREAELNAHDTDILKADIKGAAAGIKNIEDKLNPKKKVNKWKDKSAMANLNVLIGKLAEQGQDLPCLKALHDAAKHNSEFTPAEMALLVAQAWPEVTRLRLERAAKIETTKLLDAMQSFTSGDTEEKEFAEITSNVASEGERLGDEAKVLNASCQLGCLTSMVAHNHTTTTANPIANDGIALEMQDIKAAAPSVLHNAKVLVAEHKDFMQEAANATSGGYKQLNEAIEKIEKINGTPEEDLRPDQIDALTQLVKELSAPCIYLHASQQAITAPVLEKLLVAAQRSATGESSAYYLSAVIEEISPQVERIKQKEAECVQVCDSLNALSKVLESGDNDEKKEKQIAEMLTKDQGDIKKVLQGHKARYAGWTHECPMISTFRQPVSKSAELACLSAIVSTCEGVCSRPGEDAMTHANTEIKKLFRPTPLHKGDAEKFARCLVAMEHFGHMDEGTSPEVLQQKIEEGREPLGRFRDDLRVNVTGLSTAFDLCDKIISRSVDDPEFFANDPALQEQYKNAVFDAWANVTTLQAERHANKLAKSAMQRLEALKAEQMTMDTFQADVMNDRRALNSLLEEDKDLYNEQLLLKSLGELQSINDPDAINVATRETKSQLENIETVQRHTEALKEIAASFKKYMDHEHPELKSEAVAELKQHITNYAEIVVQLQALDADGGPLRQALITAALMVDNCATDAEVLQVAQQVIGPAVLQHCSAPKSSDLNCLMSTIKEIVDQQSGSITVKDQVGAQTRATNGRQKVKDEMDSHRRRLTFRSRLAFKKRAEEAIELRQAEKTGAEWDGFNVEDVSLNKWVDNRTPCQKAFDDFDKNKDSIVTINEVIEYLLAIQPDERPDGLKDINPFQKAKMKKRLEKMDTDGDGNLSFDEFSTWWESNATGKPIA